MFQHVLLVGAIFEGTEQSGAVNGGSSGNPSFHCLLYDKGLAFQDHLSIPWLVPHWVATS